MHQRCENPKNKRFKDYGARGISVCARWAKFETFLQDIGCRPKGLTLDRKNNDQGYFPENCHWATLDQQARNTRRTVLSPKKVHQIRSFAAIGMARRKIAEKFGISKSVTANVINRRTWANV